MRLLMCSVGKAFVPVSIFCPHFSTIHPVTTTDHSTKKERKYRNLRDQ